MLREISTLCFVTALCGTPLAGQAPVASGAPQDASVARLEREIARLATIAGGRVGVGAIHLETGRSAYLNRHEAFPMASSYKVPIAVQLLTRVDRNEIRLDSMIALRPGDLHPGSGIIAELLDDPGVSLSVRNLLELMLLISDNSATDVVLRTAGGAAAVSARMRDVGASGIRVDRPTIQLIGAWTGIAGVSDTTPPVQYREMARAVPDSTRRAAAAAFSSDPRDTSTPEAMARLLEKIWRGQTLSPAGTQLLLDIMRRSTTGADRLKGMLPPGTDVSHKTGTIGGTTNDVGIISLPEGAGHVVTVVFVGASDKPVPERERAIAQIARAVYDYFLFVVPPGTGR